MRMGRAVCQLAESTACPGLYHSAFHSRTGAAGSAAFITVSSDSDSGYKHVLKMLTQVLAGGCFQSFTLSPPSLAAQISQP